MKEEDIHLYDWQRILFGEIPAEYIIEIFIRTALTYIVLMVAMRLMGKRMASQLGRNEMIAMMSLAAAIGVPLQSPDRGILAIVVIAIIVVITQQVIATKVSKNESFEALTQDDVTVLVEDCHFHLEKMWEVRLTKERVIGQLRHEGICHLGEVKRLYIEANGSFTIIENEEPVAGLCIIPSWDVDYISEVCKKTDEQICRHCGYHEAPENTKCTSCGSTDRTQAVIGI